MWRLINKLRICRCFSFSLLFLCLCFNKCRQTGTYIVPVFSIPTFKCFPATKMSWTQAYSTFMPKPCSSNIHTRMDVSGETQVQYVAWGVGGPRNWTTNLLIGRWHCCQMKDNTQKPSADERGHAQMLSNRFFLSFLVFGSHRCHWRFTHRRREHFKSTKVSLVPRKTFYSCALTGCLCLLQIQQIIGTRWLLHALTCFFRLQNKDTMFLWFWFTGILWHPGKKFALQ